MDPIRILAATASRRRWLAILALAIVGAAALSMLTLMLPRIRGDEDVDISDIVARATKIAAEPVSSRLTSYIGELEFITTDRNADPQEERVRGTLWSEPPDRYRLEMEMPEPADRRGERIILVSDGKQAWWYDSSNNSYSRRLVDRSRPTGITSTGGLPELVFWPQDFSIEDVLEALADDTPESRVSVTSGEQILGRKTYLVQASSAAEDCDDNICSSAGSVRLWLDKQYLLPLRLEFDPGPEGEWFSFRFTSIDFNVDIGDELFQFTPPPGAVPLSVRLLREHVAQGTLAPTWLPEGYAFKGSESHRSSRQGELASLQVETRLEAQDGGLLTVKQELRRQGLPDSLKRGTQIEVRGRDAWLDHRTDGFTVLVWEEGALTVTITANQLSDGDLLRIAASMERLPEDDTDEISPAPAE